MNITLKLTPIISKIDITQENLNLNDEEMQNTEALLKYVQEYFTPIGFKCNEILKYD